MSTMKLPRNRSASIKTRSRRKSSSVLTEEKHSSPGRRRSIRPGHHLGLVNDSQRLDDDNIRENHDANDAINDFDNEQFSAMPLDDKLLLTEQWVTTTVESLKNNFDVYSDRAQVEAVADRRNKTHVPQAGKQHGRQSQNKKSRKNRRRGSKFSRDSVVSVSDSISTSLTTGIGYDKETETPTGLKAAKERPSYNGTKASNRTPVFTTTIETQNATDSVTEKNGDRKMKPSLPFLTFTPAGSNLEQAADGNVPVAGQLDRVSSAMKTSGVAISGTGKGLVPRREESIHWGEDVRDKGDFSCRNETSNNENTTDPVRVQTSCGASHDHVIGYNCKQPLSARPPRDSNANPTIFFYLKVCEKLQIQPLRKIVQQFGKAHLSFKNLTLTTRDMKAVCLALQKETFANSLDFTGNFMNAREIDYVITVLNRLHTVFQVSLCNNCLAGEGLKSLSQFLLMNDFLTRLNISGNNKTLEDLDLSWNHLRRCGAIGIAKGLQKNTALRTVNLAWNGFGFEGCVAIGDMLCNNFTITELDLAYNRISPPALLELLRGIAGNKTLRILKIGYNPITASFSSIILTVVKKHQESALENIDMAGVVVDKEFVSLLEEIQRDRFFIVNYEVSLPVKKMSREEMREKIGLPSAYNVDPLRMLYLLKEKMRASDFFYKINKDHDDGLQRDELYTLFDEAGLPVTGSVIDKIMEFMDTNGDGTIDLGEFLQGDKKIKNMSRRHLKQAKDENYSRYSRTFQKAHLDPITLALKVDHQAAPMRQARRLSVAKSVNESEAEDNNHLKIP